MARHGEQLLEHDIPLIGLDRFDLGDDSQQVLAERLHRFEPERGEADDGVVEKPIGGLQTETVVPNGLLEIDGLPIDKKSSERNPLRHLRGHHAVVKPRPVVVDFALIVRYSQQLLVFASRHCSA